MKALSANESLSDSFPGFQVVVAGGQPTEICWAQVSSELTVRNVAGWSCHAEADMRSHLISRANQQLRSGARLSRIETAANLSQLSDLALLMVTSNSDSRHGARRPS